MLRINKRYRQNYINESIVVERSYENGVWQDVTEEVPNAVLNTQMSNRAVVIGNGANRADFKLRHLKHFSGLLGANTVQTYGCNALYRDFQPDFLIATGNNQIVNEIAKSDYVNNNVVYTNSIHTLEYPEKFYLIPFDPYADAGSTALYLAAFDGHKTIWMLGFEGQSDPGFNHNIYAGTPGYDTQRTLVDDTKWYQNQKMIFDTYDDIDFVRVTLRASEPIHPALRGCTNYRAITYRQFVLDADL